MAEQPDRDPPLEGENVPEVLPPQDVSAPEALALAAGFPGVNREQWRELVAAVLRRSGRTQVPEPAEAALRTVVDSGLDVEALYDMVDSPSATQHIGVPGLPPFVRGSRPGSKQSGWDVRAHHAHPDVETTAEAIAEDLDNGVTSLWLVLGEGAIPVDAMPRVLAGVLLDVAPVVLQAGPVTAQAAETFLALAGRSARGPGAALGNLGADPFGDALRTGGRPDLTVAADLAQRCGADFPGLRAVVVDATAVHDAGAGLVEQLGYSMAAGAACLRALTDAGLDIDAAFESMDFRYSASADQFLTIAGLRAARRLWNRVGEVCAASPGVRGQRQHAVTSSVMMTRRDPWVNMLRTTVACFASGIGGADAVTVLPFDSAIGLPDSFSRRIARNTHNLLIDEAHVARVLDPAGGSWYVESLTEQLAEAAWDWFTEIERAGGLSAAMSAGVLAERIASLWSQRRDRLAHRKEPIIGVSVFPHLTEAMPVREPYPAAAAAPAAGSLPVVRAAEDFELLRDVVDAAASDNGTRAAVFLARLGSPASSGGRATFATNLFQAAGLQTPSNGVSGDTDSAGIDSGNSGSGNSGADGQGGADDDQGDEAIVAAFRTSGTSLVCLCGTDQAYVERGAALAQALARAGGSQVWIVGMPSAIGDIPRIDGHVFPGCDALNALTTVLHGLGLTGGGGDST